MREHIPFYPLRVISRSLPATRTNRLRVSWFILGAVIGIGGTLMLMPHITSEDASIVAIEAEAPDAADGAQPDTATPDKDLAALVTEGVDESGNDIPSDPYPLTLTLTVQKNDTLAEMLTDTGVIYQEAHNAIAVIRKSYNLRRLKIGQDITVELDKESKLDSAPIIKSIILPISQTSSLKVTRNAKGEFETQKIETSLKQSLLRAGGTIDSSLYETLMAQKVPATLLAGLITAYSYDVDFQRDIHPGNTIDMMYEQLRTEDGADAGYGNILFANLNLGKGDFKIYRFVDKEGNADFYNIKGESVRKALLRTPIPGARISSRFGKRKHPILGYSKMHRGVDFAAPSGTPIYAAGDGKIDFIGGKGGYGNYLRIQHGNNYASAYAHISRFAKGLKPGSKVKQGQIIAYVGSTGLSTGPHLHYEVLIKGSQVNPANVKFKAGKILQGKELAEFQKNMEQINARLSTLPAPVPTDVAMTDSASATP